eukprot:Gb_03915 [translate_table: standard]
MSNHEKVVQLAQELRSREEKYVEEIALLKEQEPRDPHGSSSREDELLGEIAQLKGQLASIPVAVRLLGSEEKVKAFWETADVHDWNLLGTSTMLKEMCAAGSFLPKDDDFHWGVLMWDVHLRRMMSILKVYDWHAEHLRAPGAQEAYQNTLNLANKMWGNQKAQVEESTLEDAQVRLEELTGESWALMEVSGRSFIEHYRWYIEAPEGPQVLGLPTDVLYDLRDFYNTTSARMAFTYNMFQVTCRWTFGIEKQIR